MPVPSDKFRLGELGKSSSGQMNFLSLSAREIGLLFLASADVYFYDGFL